MRSSKLFKVLFPFIIMSIPWIYLISIWSQLPSSVPTHFNIDGVADKFGSKEEMAVGPLVLTVVGILVYFLLQNISKFDPKKKYSDATAKILAKIAGVMIVFLCGVTLFIIHWTVKGKASDLNLFFCGISLFIAYIGNLMHNVKPNYFAGFRLPWTLESPENWRLTHLLVSKIWFFGGIALAIISFFVPLKPMLIIFFSGMAVLVIIPIIYSYRLYKKGI